MTLTQWKPVRSLAALEINRLNRMFESAFPDEPIDRSAWVPPVDIYETEDKSVVVTVELPAMNREDIKVTFENEVLSIEGERKFVSQVDKEHYHRVERGYGSFRRSFTLPGSVDAGRVDATYQNGLLTVTLPRREEARPKQIQVNG